MSPPEIDEVTSREVQGLGIHGSEREEEIVNAPKKSRMPTKAYHLVKRDCRALLEARDAGGLRESWRLFSSKDAPPTAQFIKYAFCGGASTAVQLTVAIALGFTLLPAFEGGGHGSIPTDERERNLILVNLIAFPFSNFTAYFLNLLWVFTPGRHGKFREFLIFTTISGLSFLAGLFGGPLLIGWFGVPSWLAQAGLLVTSALVNFVCRKFLVFLR